jgi:serine/threonine protein kinase
LYLSPDVLVGSQYNDKVDNWAIGIITYEMLFGKIPFKITT